MSVIRVGFVLGQVDWLGGVNYFRNLFTAIKSLPDAKIQPVVFAGLKSDVSAFEGLTEIVRTPMLDRHTLSWWGVKLLTRTMPRRNYLLYWFLLKHRIDLVSHFGQLWRGCEIPVLGWLPDFQHFHLPEFFDEKEIRNRNVKFMDVIRNSDAVLLSSQDALKDLNRFCMDNATSTYVLHFVPSLHADVVLPSRDVLVARYKLDRPWFHIPNQFWAHKNHGVILDALDLLKQQGVRPLVIATGSTNDNRNPHYFSSLMKIVNYGGLKDDFRVLGLVPYSDVLALMRYSVAVINPSLFEGWSTSVEESKAMGKAVILSDIAVHREQNPERGCYFNATSHVDLARKMAGVLEHYDAKEDLVRQDAAQLQQHSIQQDFARRYEAIVLEVVNKNDIP